jgi:hypothetical protein
MWQRAGSEHRVRPRTQPRSRRHRMRPIENTAFGPIRRGLATDYSIVNRLERGRARQSQAAGESRPGCGPNAMLSIASPGRHVAKRDAFYSESRPDVAKRDAIHVQAACGGRRHSWTPLTRWRVVPAQMCWQHRRCGAGTSRPKHPQVQQPVLALFMHACARIDGCAAQLRTRSALLHAHSVDAT